MLESDEDIDRSTEWDRESTYLPYGQKVGNYQLLGN